MTRGLVIGLGVLGLVVVAGGGVGAYLYLRPGAAAPAADTAAPAGEVAKPAADGGKAAGGATAAPAAGGPGEKAASGAAPPAADKTTEPAAKTAGTDTSAQPAGKAPVVASAIAAGERPAGAARGTPGQPAPEDTPLARLVRLYEGMRPKEAAEVLSRLEPELSTSILMKMRERQAGKVLGMMQPEKAAQLTSRMAKARGEYVTAVVAAGPRAIDVPPAGRAPSGDAPPGPFDAILQVAGDRTPREPAPERDETDTAQGGSDAAVLDGALLALLLPAPAAPAEIAPAPTPAPSPAEGGPMTVPARHAGQPAAADSIDRLAPAVIGDEPVSPAPSQRIAEPGPGGRGGPGAGAATGAPGASDARAANAPADLRPVRADIAEAALSPDALATGPPPALLGPAHAGIPGERGVPIPSAPGGINGEVPAREIQRDFTDEMRAGGGVLPDVDAPANAAGPAGGDARPSVDRAKGGDRDSGAGREVHGASPGSVPARPIVSATSGAHARPADPSPTPAAAEPRDQVSSRPQSDVQPPSVSRTETPRRAGDAGAERASATPRALPGGASSPTPEVRGGGLDASLDVAARGLHLGAGRDAAGDRAGDRSAGSGAETSGGWMGVTGDVAGRDIDASEPAPGIAPDLPRPATPMIDQVLEAVQTVAQADRRDGPEGAGDGPEGAAAGPGMTEDGPGVAGERHEVTLRLDPPELGRLRLRAVLEGDRISLHFVVDGEPARQALSQAIPALREALAQQGLVAGQVAVDVGAGGTPGDASRHAAWTPPPAGAAPGPAPRWASPSGLAGSAAHPGTIDMWA